MKRLLLIAACVVYMIIVQTGSHVQFLVDPQTLEPHQYFTVIGCSNDCDIACCYCDIKRQPPVCAQCCEEGS